MNRRRFFGVIGGLGGLGGSLAGCLGRGSVPVQPTESATLTPTDQEEIEVPPCPEMPDMLTRETVLQFAMQFEKAYRIRKTFPENARVVSIRFEITDALTEREAIKTGDGWVVRFSVLGPAYRYYPHSNATTPIHGDPGLTAANYFVTDETVRRAHATEAVDPREQGTVVQCPPE